LFKKLNPNIPESTARVEAFQKTINLGTEDIENNERFHNHLTTGVTVEYTKGEKYSIGIPVTLLDARQPRKQ
jgi:type I restriction enzyme R subunit